MVDLLWRADLESLEAISQDSPTRRLFLRMALLSEAGRLAPMIEDLRQDEDLDEQTRSAVAEIADDPAFLFAVKDYLRRTHVVH